MFKSFKIALPALLLMLTAGQAGATYQAYWAVSWASPINYGIKFQLANYGNVNDIYTAGISGATGREAQSVSGITTSGQYAEFAPVFCVDLLQFASGNFGGAFEVDVHTGADGELGWQTPTGDGDQYRAAGGLGRAAALASAFGTTLNYAGAIHLGANDGDKNDRAIALNVAIWGAAYGSNFTYVTGLTGAQQTYYDTYYAPFASAGTSVNYYKWWDSKALDFGSTNQDFLQGQIPEPSSLLLLGSVLVSGALLPRLRRKKKSA